MDIVSPESVGLSSARLKRLENVMQRHIDNDITTGFLLLVWRHGHVAYCKSLGLMDVENQRPTQLDTLYRIYSMTKPITSVALMMLLEEGHFVLDAPVSDFIPQFKDLKVYVAENTVADLVRPMTLRHLLTHTAGMMYPNSVPDSPLSSRYEAMEHLNRETTIEQFIDWQASMPLVNQPGARWTYSPATRVLGHVVECVSGQRLGDFFQKRIFEPLGMSDTFYQVPSGKVDRLGPLYGRGYWIMDPGGAASKMAHPTKIHMGDSDLVSSAEDYLTFCRMLLNGGQLNGEHLLSRKTVAVMTSNHLPAGLIPPVNGTNVLAGYGFGLGFAVVQDAAQARYLTSRGEYNWGGAAGTRLIIDPSEDLIAILMHSDFPSRRAGAPGSRARHQSRPVQSGLSGH